MRAATRARSVLFVAAFATSGCVAPGEQELDDQDPHQPGEEIGAFAITGKLGADDCGADALNAPQTWSFRVKLSRAGTTLYWLNGREAIVGDIDKRGRFAFETHLDLPLIPKHGAAKGCTIVRRDTARGVIATSSSSLDGELSYAYAAMSDSDCSELVTGTDGAPAVLPCQMTYALTGAVVDD